MAFDLSFVGFAEADDPDAVCRFGEAQDVQPVVQQADGDVSGLAAYKTLDVAADVVTASPRLVLGMAVNRELFRTNLPILENLPPANAQCPGRSLDCGGSCRAVQLSQNDNYKTAGRRLRDVHVRSPDPHV